MARDYERNAMQTDTVVRLLASSCDARLRCGRSLDTHKEWFDRHEETIEQLVKDFLPYGSGVDCGVTFDFDKSTGEKLVMHFSFHHMDENGYYDGWTEHTVTVRPSLIHGISLSISGRNRNDVKEMLYQEFDYCLQQTCYWDAQRERYVRQAPVAVDPFAMVG